MGTTIYVAVRKDLHTGRLWFDVSTCSRGAEQARRHATRTDREVPQWAQNNPVQCVAPATLEFNSVDVDVADAREVR